jgi:hypothetical protein
LISYKVLKPFVPITIANFHVFWNFSLNFGWNVRTFVNVISIFIIMQRSKWGQPCWSYELHKA